MRLRSAWILAIISGTPLVNATAAGTPAGAIIEEIVVTAPYPAHLIMEEIVVVAPRSADLLIEERRPDVDRVDAAVWHPEISLTY
jgi:hypothetical protein